MADYQFIDETEAATLKAQPQLGEGYESKCLPGWIESFGRWHREGWIKELSPGAVSNLLHTLIAARRRNWLMGREIERLQAENATLDVRCKDLDERLENVANGYSELMESLQIVVRAVSDHEVVSTHSHRRKAEAAALAVRGMRDAGRILGDENVSLKARLERGGQGGVDFYEEISQAILEADDD